MIEINEIEVIRDHIEEQLNMKRDNNLKQIKKDIEEGVYGGRYVKDHGNYYYVIGACATIEDYYWVKINKHREICFDSCVGVPGELIFEVPENMIFLEYLLTWEAKDVADKVKSFVESTGKDVLFTKINIKGELY